MKSRKIENQPLSIEELTSMLEKCTAPFEVRDIVEQQQAEIEKLKKLLTEEEAKYNKCAKLFYIAGVKELAKRLKDYYINHNEYKRPYAHAWIDFLFDVTDNLVAEMAGETE